MRVFVPVGNYACSTIYSMRERAREMGLAAKEVRELARELRARRREYQATQRRVGLGPYLKTENVNSR
jgi:hypothetical protein